MSVLRPAVESNPSLVKVWATNAGEAAQFPVAAVASELIVSGRKGMGWPVSNFLARIKCCHALSDSVDCGVLRSHPESQNPGCPPLSATTTLGSELHAPSEAKAQPAVWSGLKFASCNFEPDRSTGSAFAVGCVAHCVVCQHA
jgi:hypothetical protein